MDLHRSRYPAGPARPASQHGASQHGASLFGRPAAARGVALAALAALLAAAALLGGATAAAAVAPQAPASAAPQPSPAQAAAGFLARQLVDGTHYVFDFDGQTPDQGLTADGVFGMAAAKASGTALAAAAGWLAANSVGYLDPTGSFGGPFPGSYAKLALVAEVTGADPDAFGGVDLLGALRALECPASGRADCAAEEAGLFKNTTKDGGYPNVVTQSLTIIALSRSPVAADHPSAAAVGFLVGQQCPNGGFPALFPAADAPCQSEVDGTSFAVQALLAAGRSDAAAQAVQWLSSVRQPDGSFVGEGKPNSNSTGLAIQALVAAGQPAGSSVRWLEAQQVGCSGPAAQRGAVTYAGTFGPDALRATAQATLGLAQVPLTTVSADEVASAAPIMVCASTPAPSHAPSAAPTTPAGPGSGTSPGSGSPGSASASSGPVAQPAANPPLAATNGVSGPAVRLLTGLGSALVIAGVGVLLAARRRA